MFGAVSPMRKALVIVLIPLCVVLALWMWRSRFPKIHLDHKIVDIADGYPYAESLKQNVDKESSLAAVLVQTIPNDRIDYIFEPTESGGKYAVVVSLDNALLTASISSYGDKGKAGKSLGGGSSVRFDFSALKTSIAEIVDIAENHGGREFRETGKPGDLQRDLILKAENGKLVWAVSYDLWNEGRPRDLKMLIDPETGVVTRASDQ
jgi:hypothetical protein